MRYFGVRATAFMLGLQALTRQRVSKAQRYGLCEVYSRAHQGTKRSKGPAISACLHTTHYYEIIVSPRHYKELHERKCRG